MIIPATRPTGAANDPARPYLALVPTGPRIMLALDLGSNSGWALHGRDRTITSGVQTFRPNRFEGGGMAFLRFNHWLGEVNRRCRCSPTASTARASGSAYSLSGCATVCSRSARNSCASCVPASATVL